MKFNWIELIGILATLFVFIGFTQSGENKIRIFNMIGSIIFVIYGLLIGSLSVWLLNGACFILNVIKIFKSRKYINVIKTDDSCPDISKIKIK